MQIYLRMAENPYYFVGSPFGYRIGQPLLVHLMSISLDMEIPNAFYILTTIFTFLTALLLAYWLCVNGVSFFISILLACAYLLSFPGAFTLSAWALVDAPLHFLLILGLIAIQKRQWVWLGFVLFLGGFFKENIVVILPMAFVSIILSESLKSGLKIAIVITLSFLTSLLIVRTGIFFKEPIESSISATHLTQDYFKHVINYWGGIYGFLTKTFYVFAIYWFSLLFVGISMWRKHLSLLVLLLFTLAQIPFATDIERMVALAFPVIFLMTGFFSQRIGNIAGNVLVIVFLPVTYFLFQNGSYYKESVVIFSLFILMIYVYALMREARFNSNAKS
ncbi:MAG: hypothetical protein WBJ41_09170 [Chromatiaceae bacterium]